MIRNQDQRSKDYGDIVDKFRPGHADYTYWMKYGIRDHRGGGRSSARETAARVAAGGVARKALAALLPRCPDPGLHGADGRARDRPGPLGLGGGRAQPVLDPRPGARRRSGRITWTSCASPAIPWAQ